MLVSVDESYLVNLAAHQLVYESVFVAKYLFNGVGIGRYVVTRITLRFRSSL